MPIYFYSTREVPYGCFSNFSTHGFEIDGVYYKTCEHYFQAMKFSGSPQDMLDVRRAATPKQAAAIGRDRSRPLRPDWEAVKDDIMRRGVLRKFEAHVDLAELLLGTGDERIVEAAPGDRYWGAGPDGTGRNMLGQILMETRKLLRERASGKP